MNKKALTLSIVIPVYNEEDQIAACLEAILAQSEPPEEIIVVDNNSRDATDEIVRRYPSVRLLQEPRQGIVYARNTGFNAARSDLIGRIDADSHLADDWVKQAKELCREAGSDTAWTGPCDFRKLYGRKLWLGAHKLVYFWSSRLFLGHRTLFGSNMVIHRSMWNRVRDDVCLRTDIHEDMDLSRHIRNQGGTIKFTDTLRASISPRRIARMWHYPKMWLKTILASHR